MITVFNYRQLFLFNTNLSENTVFFNDYRYLCLFKSQRFVLKIKRDKFQSDLKSTCKIADLNAREALLNDPNRSKQAREEDLDFFDDNFGVNAERKI